ncbi:fluoride efflux transporter CrcB [Staphylococcus canis]|uniref:Fluoride-specific ion channel FluC n=1 Tax=Staphylococcus canis TaxID=2724942 RepID=A0ABS0TBA8_9STAP|nr:fluoride efflux transporter CrcB [Staphylococcus canis]MBI5975697.1 fluoride efflux transporter CrcB [Staphylococcus canis]
MTLILIMIGGGLGASLRLFLSDVLQPFKYKFIQFPMGTLVVNFLGAFLISFLSGFIAQHQWLNLFLITGFLGGFTTFSTLALEMVQLLKQHQFVSFVLYSSLQYIGCLLLCWIGFIL